MEQLFASGHIADLILLLMAAEYLFLRLYLRRAGQCFKSLGLGGYLLSGAFLLLALRAALTDMGWPWTALFLAAAFAVHLADLHGRLTRSGFAIAPERPGRSAPKETSPSCP
jgi:ABC-type uncharacterized transport system permease subunit